MQIQTLNSGSVQKARCSFHKGQYKLGSHIHQFLEIVYVIDGDCDITVDGVTENVKKGSIAVIFPFQIHSFETKNYCHLWMCVFSNDFISDFISEEELFGSPKIFHFEPKKSTLCYIDDHLIDSNEMPFVPLPKTKKKLKALLAVIFEEFTQDLEFSKKDLKIDALSKILLYINKHFKENISLQDVGEALGYNKNYISHCISAMPNMNFRVLLNTLRVDYAKTMLSSDEFNMIDIALESGFDNERSFYRAFQSLTGLTPGEYRKKRFPKPKYKKYDTIVL